jgi:hypothetical protein
MTSIVYMFGQMTARMVSNGANPVFDVLSHGIMPAEYHAADRSESPKLNSECGTQYDTGSVEWESQLRDNLRHQPV